MYILFINLQKKKVGWVNLKFPIEKLFEKSEVCNYDGRVKIMLGLSDPFALLSVWACEHNP